MSIDAARRVAVLFVFALSCHRSDSRAGKDHDRVPAVVLSHPTPPFGDGASAAALPALVEDGDGVFFVGNSFFGWENRPLPDWVAALGKASSPPIRISVGSDIVFGNQPLGSFLQHEATRQAL